MTWFHDTYREQTYITLFPTVDPGMTSFPRFRTVSTVAQTILMIVATAIFCSYSNMFAYFIGSFMFWWIVQAGSHSMAHRETHMKAYIRVILEVVNVLGLLSSHENHKLHHMYQGETRYNWFSDLNTPWMDIITNKVWNFLFHKYYKKGEFSEKISIGTRKMNTVWLLMPTLGLSIANYGFSLIWNEYMFSAMDIAFVTVWMGLFTFAMPSMILSLFLK